MDNAVAQIFDDKTLVFKIQQKLPRLFLLAEIDNSRNGKLGMEIGSTRERILIAMLMYKFGVERVNAEIPITEREVDVYVDGMPLSIKTVSGSGIRSVKLIWTVDASSAVNFVDNYQPKCDMMLAAINWGGTGHLLLFSKAAQLVTLRKMGRENYMKLPVSGTNARGVEISAQALGELANSSDTRRIDIKFIRTDVGYNPYKRWLEHWSDIK